jgi:hypothetical protein
MQIPPPAQGGASLRNWAIVGQQPSPQTHATGQHWLAPTAGLQAVPAGHPSDEAGQQAKASSRQYAPLQGFVPGGQPAHPPFPSQTRSGGHPGTQVPAPSQASQLFAEQDGAHWPPTHCSQAPGSQASTHWPATQASQAVGQAFVHVRVTASKTSQTGSQLGTQVPAPSQVSERVQVCSHTLPMHRLQRAGSQFGTHVPAESQDSPQPLWSQASTH